MAQLHYRADLNTVDMPLVSTHTALTLISPPREETVTKHNTPKVMYMHNFMPTREGLVSIGYTTRLPAISPAIQIVADVRTLYGNARTKIYIAWDTLGRGFWAKDSSAVWTKLALTVGGFNINNVTIATVRGVSYIYFKNLGCYQFDEVTNELVSVTLSGLTLSNILGILDASGYLLAYNATDIVWSSTIDPTDFVPSSTTGAGGGSIQDIQGAIKFAVPSPNGFIVYADNNAVSASYTGNVQFPWRFLEIENSGGGLTLDSVAYEANLATHYTYSTVGFQAVTDRKAESILPEITDFLTSGVVEDFNEITEEFSSVEASTSIRKKIKFIGSRYLIVSYGVTEFTHALVYDNSLNKIGKLKITHVDVFEYIGTSVDPAKNSIAFIDKTGLVKTVNFSLASSSSGVILLGRFQYIRSRMINIQSVQVGNVDLDADLNVQDLYSIDGYNYSKKIGTVLTRSMNTRIYGVRATGLNHALLLQGQINLNSLVITYTLAGNR